MTSHQLTLALRLSLAAFAALIPGPSLFAQGQQSSRVPEADVEIFTFYTGEFDRPTFSMWGPRIGCSDPRTYVEKRCSGRRYGLKEATDGVAGNKCGYRGYAAVCLNR